MAGVMLAAVVVSLVWAPSQVTETLVARHLGAVRGHGDPDGAVGHPVTEARLVVAAMRSRTKTSATALVSPETRLEAAERKAT